MKCLATFIAILGISGCASNHDAAPSPSPLPKIATVAARDGIVRPQLRISGVITPYRQVGVSSALSEPIVEVDVREGDRVRRGDVLARLETDDLQAELAATERTVDENRARLSQTAYGTNAVAAQDATNVRAARAALSQARFTVSGAQRDYDRYATLAGHGYLPQQTLDQQRLAVVNDEQAVDAAVASLQASLATQAADGNGSTAGEQQAGIAGAQAAVDSAIASVAQLQRQIARSVITAPIDGVVEAVNANPGEYPAGRQLFTIADDRRVYAILSASTAQAVRIVPSASATVATAGTDAVAFHGDVEAVLDQIQPGTTNFLVKVVIANEGYRLHAGMPVIGTVDLPHVRGTVVQMSAFTDDDRTSIYAVRAGVVRKVPVRLRADDGRLAVVSGVDAGTHVVSEAQSTSLSAGDRVRE